MIIYVSIGHWLTDKRIDFVVDWILHLFISWSTYNSSLSCFINKKFHALITYIQKYWYSMYSWFMYIFLCFAHTSSLQTHSNPRAPEKQRSIGCVLEFHGPRVKCARKASGVLGSAPEKYELFYPRIIWYMYGLFTYIKRKQNDHIQTGKCR